MEMGPTSIMNNEIQMNSFVHKKNDPLSSGQIMLNIKP